MTSQDGHAVAYSRAPVSGWLLGLALTWDGKHYGEYLDTAANPPTGMPWEVAKRCLDLDPEKLADAAQVS